MQAVLSVGEGDKVHGLVGVVAVLRRILKDHVGLIVIASVYTEGTAIDPVVAEIKREHQVAVLPDGQVGEFKLSVGGSFAEHGVGGGTVVIIDDLVETLDVIFRQIICIIPVHLDDREVGFIYGISVAVRLVDDDLRGRVVVEKYVGSIARIVVAGFVHIVVFLCDNKLIA